VRRSRRRLAVAGLAAGLVLALAPGPAAASVSSDRYAELQRRIAETRARIRAAQAKERQILGQIAASDQRRMSLERSLALVTDQLTLATRRLEMLQAELDRAGAELAAKTAELERTVAELEAYTDRFRDRAAGVYMRGPTTYEAVLFGAADFHAFVAGLAYADRVLQVDVDAVDRIRELKASIEAQRAEVESRRAELDRQTAAVAREQARLAGLRERQAGARDAVLAEIDYKRELLRRVQSEKAAYAAALQSYLEESQSIAELLRRAQRGQQVVQGQGGYLKWPVSGRVTSEFGWRTHPVYGYRSFHTGIDIAAPAGTTVHAARAGEVLYVGYRGAFGLIVLVDHGGSLATMYAHLARAYVSPGDAVSLLGAVGAVGCTGWCTGPHLHFEVRVAGEPQNPRAWL
jgi:murein DD-endopeptidase MepM/ murein hydrolase activator NlpD